MNSTAQTSIIAYYGIQHQLPRSRQKVYDAICRLYRPTNMEIAEHLGWSINRVTPRVKELREYGKVTCYGNRKCKVTGNPANVWGAI